MDFILYFIKWLDQMRKRESEGLMINGSGGIVWLAVVEAWGKGREVRVRVWWSAAVEAWFDWWQWRHEEKGERWEWDQRRKMESEVRVEKRRELGESKSESKDQEWETIIKILNTHATVIVHICTITVAIVYLYTSLHPLMWVIFCSNCVKLVTFSILHIYAKDYGDARLL